MPIVLKASGATLTSTLTTPILTAAANETIRIHHLTVSNGATAGTLTVSVFDHSANLTIRIIDARPLVANTTVELFDLILEPNDQIRAGATTTTGAMIYLAYLSETP